MSASSSVTSIMSQIASQFPVALVLLVGLVLAIMSLSRIPRPAMAAGAGLAILLLLVVLRPVGFTIIGHAVGYDRVRLVLGIIGFFFNLIEAVALGALIFAVLADRPQATPGKPLI